MNYWANKVQNNFNIPPPAGRQITPQMPNVGGPTGQVIMPPPNANPFQSQSNLYPNQPSVQTFGPGRMLQQQTFQQVGEIFIKPAVGIMKENLVNLEKKDDGFTYVTMKVPTKDIENDPYLKSLL